MISCWRVLLLLLLLTGVCSYAGPCSTPTFAQAPQKCIKCRSLGRLPCPEHPREECEWERGGIYCSFIAACKVCGGVGWIDCPACKDEAVEKDLAARQAQVVTSKPVADKLDAAMKRPLRQAQSEHFVLVWEMDELKVGRERLKAHALLHLYQRRLEEMRKLYFDSLHPSEADFKVKCYVYIWGLLADHREASMRFCEMSEDGGVKLMGAVANYSVCGIKQFFQADEDLHRDVVHNVAHLLLAHANPSKWFGNVGGGWADEGLAHWFEDKLFNYCATYCYEEQNTFPRFRGGSWKPTVRKMVAADQFPGLPSLLQLNTDQLSLEQHMVAFSLVDYLMQLDGTKLNAVFKLMKEKHPSREALQQVYGKAPLQLQSAWKAWVLETYPASKGG